MEFVISKDELLKGVSRVQSIIERKTALPILSNVLVDASENSIELIATDLEVGVKERFAATVKSEGTVTVGAKKLHEIVKELPESEVKFESTENDWIKITSGRAIFRMAGLSADDYPILPSFESEEFASLPAALLGDMMEMVQYAMSVDEMRYSLNGVYLNMTATKTGRSLRMAATDGHRLSIIDRKLPDDIPFEMENGVIIPRKGINELRKLLYIKEGDVRICFKDRNLIIRKENLLLIIRLIDGEFPDYEQVIPSGNDKHVTVNRDMLAAALRRCSIFSTETTHGVKLDISRKTLEITSSDPNLGDAREELPVIYEGDQMAIGFNARFFLDVVNVIKDEDVHLEFAEPLSPGLVRTPSEPGFIAVIMPMRL